MIVQDTRRAGMLRHCFFVAAAFGIAGALMLDPGAAFAGACKKTTRTTATNSNGSDPVNVHTSVRNEAKGKTYNVVIKRDGVTVQTGTISLNGSSAKVAKLEKRIDGSVFDVTISSAGGGSSVTTGTFDVSTASRAGKNTSTWNLPPDANSACRGPVNVSCSKSFKDGKLRWNTTFVIEN